MANNQYVNKVVFGAVSIIDITPTTAVESDVAQGKVFFKADGSQATGTATGGGTGAIVDRIETLPNGADHHIITGVDISDTTAVASDVAQGKYFYDATGTKTAGTASGGGSNISWFGAENAELLYQTSCIMKLSDMYNWGTLTPSSSQQSLTYPATDYTIAGQTAPIYDRYGNGYHDGSIMYLSEYSYFVVSEAISYIGYTTDEALLGIAHSIGSSTVSINEFGAGAAITSSGIQYQTDDYSPYYSNRSNYINLNYGRYANGNYNSSGSYGAYINASASANASYSSNTPEGYAINYVNFVMPKYYLRENASYFPSSLWQYVDANNSGVKVRHRLYRAKRPAPVENTITLVAQELENLDFVSW